jgi:hypothetical protein
MYQAGTVKKQGIPNTLIKVVLNECESGTSSELQLFLTESTKDLLRIDGETQTEAVVSETEQISPANSPANRQEVTQPVGSPVTANELFNFNVTPKVRVTLTKKVKRAPSKKLSLEILET